MILKEEIKKIADLARIEVSEMEAEKLSQEMGSILSYVSEIKSIAENLEEDIESGLVFNIFREDADSNEPGSYRKEIIAEFPNKEGDYLKVKKIL